MPNAVSKLCSFEELTVSLIPVHPRLYQRGSEAGQCCFYVGISWKPAQILGI